MNPIKVRCNKDCVFVNGDLSFTRGETYTSIDRHDADLDEVLFRDDQGDPHSLGGWSIHFTIINPKTHE